jgi:predicted AAA+ superfamily ATPase
VAEIQKHYLRGALFENFIFSEISKHYYNQGINPGLFYWRDNIGNEVDCIIQDGVQKKILEIKSAQTINSAFFKGIKYYQKISEIDTSACYLVYGGNENQQRSIAQVLSWQNMDDLFKSL